MPGPKKRTPQQILEYQIRTQVWLEFLMEGTGAKSINQLGAIIDDTAERGGTKWADYANLKKASFPNQTTLKIAESVVSGSHEAFFSGPKQSRIFDCMWSNLGEIHKLVESDSLGISHELFWLNQLLPHGYLRQCDDVSLQAVIGGIAKILESNKVSPKQNLDIGIIPTQLSFFSGCIAVLRFAIERDYYHQYSYVIELVDIVLQYLDSEHAPSALYNHRTSNLILTWLYAELERWAAYSQAGIFYRYNGRYPKLESFLKYPKSLVSGYKNIVVVSHEGSPEDSISLEAELGLKENSSWFKPFRAAII
ncbi:hypothetical protein [Arenicella xantha]|uniref:Uncharacterized protein n=1 Tax=Arenicella xantha TaxID=644221 RepID=A0A395JPH9_9GAMM|nr:hypothetical protein [Arenicella xantha]RBP53509.1 hypothetical protein DFR28_101896 [Arenicella xantha]